MKKIRSAFGAYGNERKAKRQDPKKLDPNRPGGDREETKSNKNKKSMKCHDALVRGLKNAVGVDQRLMPFGRDFTLTATIGSSAGTASVVWQDPCGYYSSLSIPATPTQRLEVQGNVTADNLAAELHSHALLVGQFNYDANYDAQIGNRIKIFDPTFDETLGANVSIKASTQKRNTQQVTGLQTLREDAFLLQKGTVLTAPVLPSAQLTSGDLTVSLTCWNVIPVSYHTLVMYGYDQHGVKLGKEEYGKSC